MKIDDKGRAFFSSIETLERMDQLQEAVEAYVDDVAPRVLGAIATAVWALATNSLANRWRVVEDRESSRRFIAIAPISSDLIRVEFGYTRRKQYGEFPCDSGVGIWADKKLDFGAIVAATRSAFSRPITGGTVPGYPIFEYLSDWPDPRENDWVDLHPICSDDGKQVSNVIAAQILTIAQLLEAAPQCLQPTRGTSSAPVESFFPVPTSAETDAVAASIVGGEDVDFGATIRVRGRIAAPENVPEPSSIATPSLLPLPHRSPPEPEPGSESLLPFSK
jgi:hypothetical protein